MKTREKSSGKQIVPAPAHGLAVRSAAIVARGLRDLARDSNWLAKKVFSGHASDLATSPAGQVCALSLLVRQHTERIALYDIEHGVPSLALGVPGEPGICPPGMPSAFAWSPTARYLVAAWGAWQPKLYVFDLHGKMLLGAFGEFSNFPSRLAWSDTGKYFAAATGGREGRLRLWHAKPKSKGAVPFSGDPTSDLGVPECSAWRDWQELESLDAESGADSADGSALSGFGRTLFSPDERTLASVVEIEGEWADDSIAFLAVPKLRRRNVFHAQGHITDLSWTFDSCRLVYCSAGQANILVAETMESVPLPFGAELCACHPHLPLCLCFSSWLKNSAKGRLFLVDLNRLTVYDDYAAEGVVDLRWSLDGSKAYAVTAEGLAYIYEPPLL
jgi:WD40 repeat protein